MGKSHKLSKEDIPFSLRNIKAPPSEIYYKGDVSLLHRSKMLAVVGSRKMSRYANDMTFKFVEKLARVGITIVSGFMYGIDTSAHKAALISGGNTIAVLPCGIDLVHPSQNKELYAEMLHSQLIISEYFNKTPPKRWTYVARNRLVAGLSQAVLVVEAATNSGSMITANLALENDKKVFVVPGQIGATNTGGIYELYDRGAEIIHNVGPILEFFDLSYSDKSLKKVVRFDSKQQAILDQLNIESYNFDDLDHKQILSTEELYTTLAQLEIDGHVVNEGGLYHVS